VRNEFGGLLRSFDYQMLFWVVSLDVLDYSYFRFFEYEHLLLLFADTARVMLAFVFA